MDAKNTQSDDVRAADSAEPSDPHNSEERSGRVRPNVADSHPDEYQKGPESPPSVDQPHTSPEHWAQDVNPNKMEAGRDNNCGECARAVQSSWEGDPQVAAAMKDPNGAEPIGVMSDWAGASPEPATMDQIGDRLLEMGPGSSAIVGCDWANGGGHWFNAVNDNGTIKAIDGQSGKVGDWPPGQAGLGFDQSDMSGSDAIFFDSSGQVSKDATNGATTAGASPESPERGSVLEHPDQRVSSDHFPYLQKATTGDNPASARTIDPQYAASDHPPTLDNPDGREVPSPDDLRGFSGPVEPYTMQAGRTYYRTVGDGQNPAGNWWTEEPPQNMEQLRGDLAVDSEWNGDHGVVSFTPSEDIQGWRGTVASQAASNGDGSYLRGGGDQIWIPAGAHAGSYDIEELDIR